MTGVGDGNLAIAVHGKIAADGRLLTADPILMRLHLRAGGIEGGRLAVPQLAALCDMTLKLKMGLSRSVLAADDDTNIRMWVETALDSSGAVDIKITDWSETELDQPTPFQSRERAFDFKRLDEEPVIQLDSAMRIIKLTLAIKDVSPDSFIGKPITSLFELRENAAQILPLLEAVAERQPFRGQKMVLRDGGDEFELSGSPIVDRDGAFVGYMCQCVPLNAPTIIDSIASPGKKIDSVSDAEAPLLNQSVFGSQLGPALRQPLGRIIANADTIGGKLQGPLRSDYANYANDIAVAARHLMSLVEDLSDLEAIEKEGFAVANEAVDLADLGRRAAGLLVVKASDHHIRVHAPDEQAKMPAFGEFRRVLQILVNLITNAIRYSPDGSKITLTVGEVDNHAAIIVADEGPGIAADMQTQIFNKFERLGRSGDGGSGLGLYISRRLARAMQGDLTVESEEGKGARFTLALPKELNTPNKKND